MVRVVAGTAGGLRLKTIDSENTKPTLDRVKEAMFAILTPWTEDAVVIDVFAGNGSLGIEALSRGAKKAYLNDKSKQCCNIIKDNISFTHFEQSAEVYNLDYTSFVKKLNEMNITGDIILLDPPYRKNLIESTLNDISKLNICTENCVVMAEHALTDELKDVIGCFEKIKMKKYGNVALSLYLRKV